MDSFAIGADADIVHAFREVPEDLSKLFQVELFFMAPDKQARVCLLPIYDKEGKAWWVLGNREVSTPLLFRRPPFACFEFGFDLSRKKGKRFANG
jgi:hypothetical protein